MKTTDRYAITQRVRNGQVRWFYDGELCPKVGFSTRAQARRSVERERKYDACPICRGGSGPACGWHF